MSALRYPKLPSILWSTFFPALIGAFGSVGLATVYAWFVHRTDVPGRKVLSLLPFLGLASPGFVKAIGLVFLFSPTIGAVNQLFDWMFRVPFPLFNIFSSYGLGLAYIVGGFPLSYTIISVAVRAMNVEMEESALVLGSSPPRIFIRVTFPLLLPAFISAFVVQFMLAAGSFDYAYIFGIVSSSGVNTLATAIYYDVEGVYNFSQATAFTFIYVAATAVLVAIYIYLTRREFRYVTIAGRPSRKGILSLGRYKHLALIICIIIFIVCVAMEEFIVILVSLLPYYSLSAKALSQITLINYQHLFFSPAYSRLFVTALEGSLETSIVVATICAFGGAIVSYAIWRTHIRGVKILEFLNSLPYGMPQITYGFALLVTFLFIPFLAGTVYGTLWAMIIALVITWLPFAIRIMAGTIVQISKDLEDAASMTGASWGHMFRTVLLPMIKPSLALAFIYVFIDSFRTLGSVILLASPNSYVLTTFITDLLIQTSAALPIVAAVSVFMLMLTVSVLIISNYALKGAVLGSSES